MPPTFVRDRIAVHAPLDRLWLLSTRVELVRETLGMRLVGGITTGFIQAGSRVVWKGWKFGLPTEHHTLITGYAPPHPAALTGAPLGPELRAETSGQWVAWFRDEQEQGRFASFQHDHWFREEAGPVTVLEDEVRFALPWYLGGTVAARWIMEPYVRRLVRKRFQRLKRLAEGDAWQSWVESGGQPK